MKSAFAEHLVATGRITRERLEAAFRGEWLDPEPIGRLALLHGLLSAADIDAILELQKTDENLFGEIAVGRGILTEQQLNVLFKGQGIRACLELIEDLALSGLIEFGTGMEAVWEFVSRPDFTAVLACRSAARG